MITYTYVVRCPECEDEFFDFFDEAKEFAMSCMSKKPVITQTEVNRNDFGECTDHCDLGTVWSWEDVMKETDSKADDSCSHVLCKADLEDIDSEFDALDNSVDFEIEEVSETPTIKRKPIPEGMTIEALVETLEENEDEVECKTCFNLFPKAECEKQDYGYVCSTCNNTVVRDTKDTYSETQVGKVIADLVVDEFEAIDGYEIADEVVQHSRIPEDKKTKILDTLEHIRQEEEEHIDELRTLATSHASEKHSTEPDFLYEDTDKDTVECAGCNELYPKEDCFYNENNGWICPTCQDETVECTWCNRLFGKDQCRYEVDLGWLCDRCEAAIKSRGETLTFREGNYWDFLDESVEETRELTDLVKDSISHLTNDLGKDPWAADFADDVIKDIENNYDTYVPEDMEHYNHWCSVVASEVSRQVNNQHQLDETLEPAEELTTPETSEVSGSHLNLCPECGKNTFDIETGICVECGFN